MENKKIIECVERCLEIINDPKFYKKFGVTRNECFEWLESQKGNVEG